MTLAGKTPPSHPSGDMPPVHTAPLLHRLKSFAQNPAVKRLATFGKNHRVKRFIFSGFGLTSAAGLTLSAINLSLQTNHSRTTEDILSDQFKKVILLKTERNALKQQQLKLQMQKIALKKGEEEKLTCHCHMFLCYKIPEAWLAKADSDLLPKLENGELLKKEEAPLKNRDVLKMTAVVGGIAAVVVCAVYVVCKK